jgi:hypothetical protein
MKIIVLLGGMWAAKSSALRLPAHSGGQRYAPRPVRVARETACGLDELPEWSPTKWSFTGWIEDRCVAFWQTSEETLDARGGGDAGIAGAKRVADALENGVGTFENVSAHGVRTFERVSANLSGVVLSGVRAFEGGVRALEGGVRVSEDGVRAFEGGVRALEGGVRVSEDGLRLAAAAWLIGSLESAGESFYWLKVLKVTALATISLPPVLRCLTDLVFKFRARGTVPSQTTTILGQASRLG